MKTVRDWEFIVTYKSFCVVYSQQNTQATKSLGTILFPHLTILHLYFIQHLLIVSYDSQIILP